MKDRLFDILMPLLPKNDLSHWVGRLVHKRLPEPLARQSIQAFAKYYNINMDEAEFPITHYQSIGELFTRRLKPGARPIAQGAAVVHNSDAVISECGPIAGLTLIQAKDHKYTVPELLRNSHFSPEFEGGMFATYYLCPTDYHRVHSPVDGEIIWSCHVPGELWPVNKWSTNAIPNLFAVNERVVVMMQTPRGKVALVMVAATNVGNMTMTFDPHINTRFRKGPRQVKERTYNPPLSVKKGDEVGIFHMGSTVVMLFEKGVIEGEISRFRGHAVKMGSELSR